MERLLDFGYGLLSMAEVAAEWLLTPLSDIGIPLIWNDINYGSFNLPISATVADFVLGAGITFVLGFKLVKFITDIVL